MGKTRPFVIGWDHHRTPVSLRERLAVVGEQERGLLDDWVHFPAVEEAVVLSTCNRTECYLVGHGSAAEAIEHFAERQGIDVGSLLEHGYIHERLDCVRHLFRVISSLESMVLGEYQIVHQVKQAYSDAQDEKTVGSTLNKLFQGALNIAKTVRTETGIGKHKVSVASVAIDLAKQVHGRLDNKKVLVISAGEMAELTVTHLMEHGAKQFTLINRTQDRARNLAETIQSRAGVSVDVGAWKDLATAAAANDIIITSTGAPHAVITADLIRPALQRRRNPLLIIDLAVPRDVEPALGEFDECYVFNIDHLDGIVVKNQTLRDDEVDAAAGVVERAASEFQRSQEQDIGALLGAVAKCFAADQSEEIANHPELDEAGQEAVRHVVNKLRHRVMSAAKEHADSPEVIEFLKSLIETQTRH